MSLLQSLRNWAHGLTGYFVFLLLTGTLGPFLFGYHLGELNAPQDVITCVRRSIRVIGSGLPQCIPMNAVQIGMVSSAFTVGGLVGALAAGPTSTRYGRLRPMRFTTIFATLGPVAEALAPNIGIMIVGRFLSGIGAGAALVVVPIYVAEISLPKDRGFFGAFTQIMVNSGIFTSQLLGYFLSHDAMWRFILATAGVIGLVQLAGLIFAVDSPQWQADHGQPRAAKVNLRRIRGSDVDLTEETKSWSHHSVHIEDEEQQALLDHERPIGQRNEPRAGPTEKKASIGTFEVLVHPQHGHATLVVMMVLAAQQFCGINSIVMYGVSLLSHLLKANSALLNIFLSILNIVATAAFAPLIDVWGRKACLLASISGMGLSSVLLGIAIHNSLSVMSIVAVLLFVGSFAIGLGPVPFMLSSELVGPEAVGATQSWGLAANWVATFMVAQFFPILNERLGGGIVYFVFASLAALFFVLVFLFVPESKGKKDADEVWGRARIPQE